MITHVDLTDRIKRAKAERDKAKDNLYLKRFWVGYIHACRDIRNDLK